MRNNHHCINRNINRNINHNINRNKKKNNKKTGCKNGLMIFCRSLLLACLLFLFPAGNLPVLAQEERPRLIQTTTPGEEWEAVTALDILQVCPAAEEGETGLLRAQEANLPAIVQIDTEHYRGSGVIFEITRDYVIILSNKHLLEYDNGARVTFHEGRQVQAETIRLSDRYDMGIVTVSCESIPQEERMRLKRICFNSECSANMESGDDLFIIGSREGPGANVYVGTIADPWWYSPDFNTHMLFNHCNAEHGISGGGTFDVHGHYLGMLSAGNGSDTLSLPLTTILEEYPVLTEGLLDSREREAQ